MNRKQVSLRIPPDFHRELENYANGVGVSLNQLALLSLRKYLDCGRTVKSPDAQPNQRKPKPRKPKRRRR